MNSQFFQIGADSLAGQVEVGLDRTGADFRDCCNLLDAQLFHVPQHKDDSLFGAEVLYEALDLLHQVKQRGMALELNTSGYETRGSPFPSLEIIKKAMNLDLMMVAGSDAHAPHQVGRYFDRLLHDLVVLKTT